MNPYPSSPSPLRITDTTPDLHAGAESKLLLRTETQKIIGFAFEILNQIGHGLNEKIYENSLVVLLKSNNIEFAQQRPFPVLFSGVESACSSQT